MAGWLGSSNLPGVQSRGRSARLGVWGATWPQQQPRPQPQPPPRASSDRSARPQTTATRPIAPPRPSKVATHRPTAEGLRHTEPFTKRKLDHADDLAQPQRHDTPCPARTRRLSRHRKHIAHLIAIRGATMAGEQTEQESIQHQPTSPSTQLHMEVLGPGHVDQAREPCRLFLRGIAA